MTKYVAAIAVALGLATPAFAADEGVADQQNEPQRELVLMTDAQLDEVVAGQPNTCDGTLLCVQDVNVGVVAQVPVAAAVNILGEQHANPTATAERPIVTQF